jgi:hypothetical protein
MKIEIRKAEEKDIFELSSFNEEGNDFKCLAIAFLDSLETWVGLIDGEVVAIWGVITPNILSDDVYVWLTASKLTQLHPIVFARWSREAIKTLSAYPKVHGLVLCDFEISKKWLRWLGFDVGVAEGKICKFTRDVTAEAS